MCFAILKSQVCLRERLKPWVLYRNPDIPYIMYIRTQGSRSHIAMQDPRLAMEDQRVTPEEVRVRARAVARGYRADFKRRQPEIARYL